MGSLRKQCVDQLVIWLFVLSRYSSPAVSLLLILTFFTQQTSCLSDNYYWSKAFSLVEHFACCLGWPDDWMTWVTVETCRMTEVGTSWNLGTSLDTNKCPQPSSLIALLLPSLTSLFHILLQSRDSLWCPGTRQGQHSNMALTKERCSFLNDCKL